jgi:predicted NAD-dependent protein-ADP-ribosyltransferase YbiA (DUF1768 family)
MLAAPHVYFGSNAQAPYHQLSNFHAAPIRVAWADVPAVVKAVVPQMDMDWFGDLHVTFASSEHLWQALKATTAHGFSAFTVGERFGTLQPDVFLATLCRGRPAAAIKKAAYWRRKQNVGIVAKLAGNAKYAHHLGIAEEMDYARESLAAERDVWLWILSLKFAQHPLLAQVLKATDTARLIEHDHRARLHPKHWGGLWDEAAQQVVGDNAMGEYLMAARTRLL